MSETTIEMVLAEIQRGYGDETQTKVDREVATNIVRRLRLAGWFDRSEVAAIIKAAGGRVLVTEDVLTAVERDAEVFIGYEPGCMRYVVEVRP